MPERISFHQVAEDILKDRLAVGFGIPNCYGQQPSRPTGYSLVAGMQVDLREEIAKRIDSWLSEGVLKNNGQGAYVVLVWGDKGRELYGDSLLFEDADGVMKDKRPEDYAYEILHEKYIPLIAKEADKAAFQLNKCARCPYHSNCWHQSLLDNSRIT